MKWKYLEPLVGIILDIKKFKKREYTGISQMLVTGSTESLEEEAYFSISSMIKTEGNLSDSTELTAQLHTARDLMYGYKKKRSW